MWLLNRPLNPSVAQLGYFVLSVVLTGLGFFVEQVPFTLAYIPLALAICHTDRSRTLWLVCGHFTWVAVISGWGLHQLGYNPALTIPAVLVTLALSTLVMTWLGIGLSSALLSLVPFFPANPLLITGAVFPGFGIWGVAALLLVIIGVEALCRPLARTCVLAAVLIAGQMLPALQPSSGPPEDTKRYVEIDISSHKAITRSGQWAQIAAVIEDGSTVILGENIFNHTDIGASAYWCRVATVKNATLYIGVMEKDGVGEVWGFEGRDCAVPSVAYRAEVGIPKISGGWLPNHAEVQSTPSGQQWLACFEGFSLYRWVRAYTTGATSVVIVSNDRLTRPIPTAVLRRKVSRQFAELFGLDVAHADTGRSILIVRQ